MIHDHAWFAKFILFVKMGLNKVKCKKKKELIGPLCRGSGPGCVRVIPVLKSIL